MDACQEAPFFGYNSTSLYSCANVSSLVLFLTCTYRQRLYRGSNRLLAISRIGILLVATTPEQVITYPSRLPSHESLAHALSLCLMSGPAYSWRNRSQYRDCQLVAASALRCFLTLPSYLRRGAAIPFVEATMRGPVAQQLPRPGKWNVDRTVLWPVCLSREVLCTIIYFPLRGAKK